jgi:hypothetical protein
LSGAEGEFIAREDNRSDIPGEHWNGQIESLAGIELIDEAHGQTKSLPV